MSAIDTAVETAMEAGCPAGQMKNFGDAGIGLQPRQLQASAAARLCDLPGGPTSVGFGGARGGGKSHWLLAQMGVDDCQRVPGLKCLLLRKVGKSNKENLEDLRLKLFTRLKHKFTRTGGVLQFENGSRIIAGHYQCEKDIDAYLGLEYDVIGVEEATTLTWRKYEHISTCCRTSKVSPDGSQWRPRIYSTTNPGGVGHAWYKAQFITPWQAGEEKETRFIPARVRDNPHLNTDYVRNLEKLTGWVRRAWLDGDWDISSGQFFTTFRRDAHVISDFDDSRAREWFCAFDYGFTHYTVCLLGCKDGDGNLYVVDEHAERLWLPTQHANAIRAMLLRHNVLFTELKRFIAGPDVFSKQADGRTIADQYVKFGVKLELANTNRINGWAEVLHRLGNPSAGIKPSLYIHARCKRLIECLPNLQHDPMRPEDVRKVDVDENGGGGDDTADALRYMVATKERFTRVVRVRGW